MAKKKKEIIESSSSLEEPQEPEIPSLEPEPEITIEVNPVEQLQKDINELKMEHNSFV